MKYQVLSRESLNDHGLRGCCFKLFTASEEIINRVRVSEPPVFLIEDHQPRRLFFDFIQ